MLNVKPILKQKSALVLKPLNKLEQVDIFAMPSRIKDEDIMSLFRGLLGLIREQIQQENTEKYLRLALKYSHLRHLYDKKINNN